MVAYKKSEDVKNRIKQAAISLFNRSGFDAVKTEDIAKHADVAKGLIFYHFKSKEGLLTEIITENASKIFSSVKNMIASLPPDRALLMLFSLLFSGERAQMLGDKWFDNGIPEKFHWALDVARQATIFPIIGELVESGMNQGLFNVVEAEITCEIMSMGFDRYLHNNQDELETIETREKFLRSAEYLLNSVLKPTRLKFEF